MRVSLYDEVEERVETFHMIDLCEVLADDIFLEFIDGKEKRFPRCQYKLNGVYDQMDKRSEFQKWESDEQDIK